VSRPSPFAVTLTASERRVLEGRLRRATAQQREALRARIVLAAADGQQNTRIVDFPPLAGHRGYAARGDGSW
jgi:hypothetical protein